MLKLLKKFSVKEWGLAFMSVGFIVLSVWAELTMPDYMSEITVLVQTPGSKMSEMLIAGGKMLLYALISLAATVCTSVCASRLATGLGATLRGELFRKVQSFSMEEIGRFSTASLITRSTNDVMQVQMLIVMGLPCYGKEILEAVSKANDIPERDVQRTQKHFNKKRANYYYANTAKRWDDMNNYDVILDSAVLGIDGCVNILKSVI